MYLGIFGNVEQLLDGNIGKHGPLTPLPRCKQDTVMTGHSIDDFSYWY
jgi:hypothetical protein